MFDDLTTTHQEEVLAIAGAIDDAAMLELIEKAGKLFPNHDADRHKGFIMDMLAEIFITFEEETHQDYIDGGLIPTLTQVLSHFCDWCSLYITAGDRLPYRRVADIFVIATTASHDHWYEPIANNLSYIPALVSNTKGGKDVSTALFDAIINTAFDYYKGN